MDPALAVSTDQRVPAGKKKMAVIEVTGIERNEILAKKDFLFGVIPSTESFLKEL